MFLDSDDVMSIECLNNRFKILNQYPSLDFLVFPVGTFCSEIGDSNYVWNNFKGDHLNRFLSHDIPWLICSVLWKKSFLISIKGLTIHLKGFKM